MGNESYPVDVSEGEEGEDDRGNVWGDIHATDVRVRR